MDNKSNKTWEIHPSSEFYFLKITVLGRVLHCKSLTDQRLLLYVLFNEQRFGFPKSLLVSASIFSVVKLR